MSDILGVIGWIAWIAALGRFVHLNYIITNIQDREDGNINILKTRLTAPMPLTESPKYSYLRTKGAYGIYWFGLL